MTDFWSPTSAGPGDHAAQSDLRRTEEGVAKANRRHRGKGCMEALSGRVNLYVCFEKTTLGEHFSRLIVVLLLRLAQTSSHLFHVA